MQRLRIRITGGKVHDVGYRVLLVNKALSFGVSNFNVFNKSPLYGRRIGEWKLDPLDFKDARKFFTGASIEKATAVLSSVN